MILIYMKRKIYNKLYETKRNLFIHSSPVQILHISHIDMLQIPKGPDIKELFKLILFVP